MNHNINQNDLINQHQHKQKRQKINHNSFINDNPETTSSTIIQQDEQQLIKNQPTSSSKNKKLLNQTSNNINNNDEKIEIIFGTPANELDMFNFEEDDEDDDEDEDDCENNDDITEDDDLKNGRVKIKMEFIENKLRRYTTFSKRKTGIMKKAYELSTLTGTQVMLLVASETGHVYTFATKKLQPMITSETGKDLIRACLSSNDDNTHNLNNKNNLNSTSTATATNNNEIEIENHEFIDDNNDSQNNANNENYNYEHEIDEFVSQLNEENSSNGSDLQKMLKINKMIQNDVKKYNDEECNTVSSNDNNKYNKSINENLQQQQQQQQIPIHKPQLNYSNKNLNDNHLLLNSTIFQKQNKNTLVALPLMLTNTTTTNNTKTLPIQNNDTNNNTNNNQIIITHPIINQDNLILNITANQQLSFTTADQNKTINNTHFIYPLSLTNNNSSNIKK